MELDRERERLGLRYACGGQHHMGLLVDDDADAWAGNWREIDDDHNGLGCSSEQSTGPHPGPDLWTKKQLICFTLAGSSSLLGVDVTLTLAMLPGRLIGGEKESERGRICLGADAAGLGTWAARGAHG